MSLEQFSASSFPIRKEWMQINCDQISCNEATADILNVGDLNVDGELTVFDLNVTNTGLIGSDLSVLGSIIGSDELQGRILSVGPTSTDKYTFPQNVINIQDNSSIILSLGTSSGLIHPILFRQKVFFSALYSNIAATNVFIGGNVPNYIGTGTGVTLPTIVSNVGVTLNTNTGYYLISVPGTYRVKIAMTVLCGNGAYAGRFRLEVNDVPENETSWNCEAVAEWVTNYDYGYKSYIAGDRVRFVGTCSSPSGTDLLIYNYCTTFENI